MNNSFYFEVFYAEIDKNKIVQGGSIPVLNRFKIYYSTFKYHILIANQLSKFYTVKVK